MRSCGSVVYQARLQGKVVRRHVVVEGRQMRRPLLLALSLSVVLALTSCAAGEPQNSHASSETPAFSEAQRAREAEHADAALAVEDAAGDNSPDVVATEKKMLVVSGSAMVRVDDPQASLREVTTWVASQGGRIDATSVDTTGQEVHVSLTARVPAAKYDLLLTHLGEIGRVLTQTTNAAEVGAEVVDLEARIKALESSIVRLQDLVAKATDTSSLIEAEEILTRRQEELDSLRAQQRYLADQVSMSTLDISLTGNDKPDDPDHNVFERSWHSFVETMGFFGELFIMCLPWLVLLSLLLAPVYFVWRRFFSRHSGARSKKMTSSPPHDETEGSSDTSLHNEESGESDAS